MIKLFEIILKLYYQRYPLNSGTDLTVFGVWLIPPPVKLEYGLSVLIIIFYQTFHSRLF